jgi:hypothetical protein
LFLLHDNALAHTCKCLPIFAHKNFYNHLSHPPYSPDLSPPNLFSIPEVGIEN